MFFCICECHFIFGDLFWCFIYLCFCDLIRRDCMAFPIFLLQRSEVHILFHFVWLCTKRVLDVTRRLYLSNNNLFLMQVPETNKKPTRLPLPMSTFEVRQLYNLNYGLTAQNTLQYADAMQCSTLTVWVIIIIILINNFPRQKSGIARLILLYFGRYTIARSA